MLEKIILIILILPPALHTASYGWWAWKKRYYQGAVGCWLLALTTILLPVLILQERL